MSFEVRYVASARQDLRNIFFFLFRHIVWYVIMVATKGCVFMGPLAPTGLVEFVCTQILQATDGNCLVYEIKAVEKPECCPKCGVIGSQTAHGYKTRYIRDLPNSGMQVILKLRAQRYLCPSCGATYMQSYKTIDKTSMTPRLRTKIVSRVLRRESFTRIADDYGISDKTVHRVFDDWAKKHHSMTIYSTPRVIGIDEAHIGKHFRLIITDPENKRLLDMLPNNKPETVYCYLRSLENPSTVRVATMDFAPLYAKAVKEIFSCATVVIDRFHVIQLVNKHMDTARKKMHDDGTVKRRLKRERTLFMANFEDLSPDARHQLTAWLDIYPSLRRVYQAKEQFRKIYESENRAQAEVLFRKWCDTVSSSVPEFSDLKEVLVLRKDDILSYFDYRYTNAYTESVNNIIKTIEKQGHGYSFEVLRAMCLMSVNHISEKAYVWSSLSSEDNFIKSWQF